MLACWLAGWLHTHAQVPADCVAGTSLIVGKCPNGVGVRLVGDQLVSTACVAQGLCVLGPVPSRGESGASSTSAVLGNCSSALAHGWFAK